MQNLLPTRSLRVTTRTVKIAADAVDGTKIADDSIAPEHLATDSVTNDAMANDSIGTTEITRRKLSRDHRWSCNGCKTCCQRGHYELRLVLPRSPLMPWMEPKLRMIRLLPNTWRRTRLQTTLWRMILLVQLKSRVPTYLVIIDGNVTDAKLAANAVTTR